MWNMQCMHAIWSTCRNCIERNQRNSRNNELGKPSPVLSKIFQLTMNFDESVRAVRDPGPRRPVGGRKDSGAQPSPPPHSKLHLFHLQTFRAPLRPRAQGPAPAARKAQPLFHPPPAPHPQSSWRHGVDQRSCAEPRPVQQVRLGVN